MSLIPSDSNEPSARPGDLFQRLKQPLLTIVQKTWFCCFSLILLGFVVRTPALRGPFLWDDLYLATGNPFIKSPVLILEAFRHYLFLDSYSLHYRPVQNISFMPDYYFWGDDPFGFHLSSIIWHVGGGVLLFFLLRRLLLTLLREPASGHTCQTIAFLLALIWTVHPVHSAAVDYISGRADSVAFCFACSGWLLFLRGERCAHPGVRFLLFGVSCLLGLLALCSRETALIWLTIFLCHQLFFAERSTRRKKIAISLCCVGLAVAYLGLRYLPAPRTETAPVPAWSAPMRAILMLRALGDYGRLMIFPSNLHMERSVFDPTLFKSAREWRASCGIEYLSMVGLGVLGLFAAGIWRNDRGRKLRVFGAAWFILGYLPISNLVPLNATVAEHWLYLPSVGFLAFLAGCVIALPAKTYSWAVTLACLFVVGLGIRSYYRSGDWASSEKFFEQTIASGGASSRAATNLALIFAKRGDYKRAEGLLRRVLQISPDDPIARNNLADALRHLNRNAEAEKVLLAAAKESKEAQKEYPRTWVVAANLARLRHFQRNDQAALAVLEKARAESPEVWELISYEAEVLREDRDAKRARALVQNFYSKNWWHYGAALALGRLYAEEGNVREANRVLLQASRLDLHDVEALNLVAQMRVRENRLNDAYLTQCRAVARQPDAPRQYFLLSDILEKMGRTAEAREAQAEIVRLENLARQNRALLN
ncbi:MAG: tetratricopeptide repeat protein [Chthoniobacterales bacterium]